MDEFKRFIKVVGLVVWAIIAIASFGVSIDHGVNGALAFVALALQGVGMFLYIRNFVKNKEV